MIVVFDTNIWLSELGLRSEAGAATRFYLKHRGARIGIPEVVRLEVTHNLTSRLMKHIERIRSEYSQLLTAFGTLREVVLPTEAQVQERISELFQSMDVKQIDIPFTFESARNSFLKTIHKVPPSHQSQQFKDGVLWADCVSLLSTDDVVLVTADKAFYKDGDYSKGVAASLQEEVRGCAHSIHVHPALVDLLESVREPIPIDGDMLQAAFIEQHRNSITGSLERLGFALGQRTSLTFNVFATEIPAVLFLDFQIGIQCEDIRSEGRTDAVLHLMGDGSYVPASGEFRNLRDFGLELSFRQADGSVSEVRNAVIHVDGIVIGHKEVSKVVRYALPRDEH